jgi:hypothetical protein
MARLRLSKINATEPFICSQHSGCPSLDGISSPVHNPVEMGDSAHWISYPFPYYASLLKHCRKKFKSWDQRLKTAKVEKKKSARK